MENDSVMLLLQAGGMCSTSVSNLHISDLRIEEFFLVMKAAKSFRCREPYKMRRKLGGHFFFMNIFLGHCYIL
jgi:hypothetical protein